MFKISGTVIKGDQYGRKLGFPTVNLEVKEKVTLSSGVYAGSAELEGNKYRAGIVISPTRKIEAHIIGYNKDAYGKMVELTTEKLLREYKNFDTEKELINQITKDIELCQ